MTRQKDMKDKRKMDAKTWKLVRRSAAMLPLAMIATQASVPAQEPMDAQHGAREAGVWVFHHEHVLGTSLELKVRAANAAEARRAEEAALREFDRQDKILSAWRADSEFSRWETTRFDAVKVSPELMEVLAGFDRWRAVTDGALDASAEAAVRLWRASLSEGRTPSAREIAETREAIAQEHWVLDRERGTAMRVSDVPLALASFAKSTVSEAAAQAAMRAGASGVMVNVGGDVIVRGAMEQSVAIADPREAADNAAAMDTIRVSDRAVATSGSYKRGVELSASAAMRQPEFSHIVDPRTAKPAEGVVSSTVIAKDAETAGALATAFSVMPVEESAALATRLPGVEYLIVAADGREVRSAGWTRYEAPGVRTVAYAPVSAPVSHVTAGAWNPAFELAIGMELPRIDDARYRRPYVAVWVEDADHFPVRTLALWTQNPRWMPELKAWYRDDQIRNLAEGTDVSKTVGSATRPPGHYSLKWDGKDNEGKPVKAGKYTVVVEASREHGGYQVSRQEFDFNGKPQKAALPTGKEMGAVTLEYRKR
jgi:thiamine biosynthesis lipoprotein